MAGAALTSRGRAARYTEMPQPRSVPLARHRGKSQIAELPRPPPEQVGAFAAAPRGPPVMLRSRPNTAGRLSAPSPTNSGPATRIRPSACAGHGPSGGRGPGPPASCPSSLRAPRPAPASPPAAGAGVGRGGVAVHLPAAAPMPPRAPAGPGSAAHISPPFPTLRHVHFGARASCSPAGDTALPPEATGPPLTARRSPPPAEQPPAPIKQAADRLRLSRSEKQLLFNFTDEQAATFGTKLLSRRLRSDKKTPSNMAVLAAPRLALRRARLPAGGGAAAARAGGAAGLPLRGGLGAAA
ncbi:transcription initiation factor TFIID subunit 4-like [Aphelocoma coerulescens]|uniref:transcription initiation factor TFIID subunit 4-like n=1 Tax=Aphelocoma coerulescens TaxID=39617 RepID=UPI0036050957